MYSKKIKNIYRNLSYLNHAFLICVQLTRNPKNFLIKNKCFFFQYFLIFYIFIKQKTFFLIFVILFIFNIHLFFLILLCYKCLMGMSTKTKFHWLIFFGKTSRYLPTRESWAIIIVIWSTSTVVDSVLLFRLCRGGPFVERLSPGITSNVCWSMH